MRITIACPAALIEDANNLAMALAFGPADALTFREPSWQDADGSLYSAASLEATDDWVAGAQTTLNRPEWDTDYTVNMAGAERAQDALYFWVPDEDGQEPPLASPGALVAIGAVDGLAALDAMGLSRVPEDEAV
ncbi:hypothetical protein [Pelagibacterium lacus]|uniref:Uncharacterized protein n=1 Tax=Pelagibacterium lacus TaxID=2282655 RepID=A0A369W3I4_9HYPH|nr:hypothetical protein [Pelagibacterium lacus]RDE08435.1 hypothetical protein DVH29_11230 [Pelagibacterium lacus]